MAKEKVERTYLDVDAQGFNAETQELIASQRQTYLADKAAKAAVVAAIAAVTPVKDGEAITGYAYTRWGQMQLIISPKAAPKATAKPRRTLADYLAEQERHNAA